MSAYSKRTWLNDNSVSATGSIVTFYGLMPSYKESKVAPLLELADCHNKVRIHMSRSDSLEDYIAKIRLIAKETSDFADYLDTVDNSIDNSNQNNPTGALP